MIPFQPESDESLRARYHKAVEKPWSIDPKGPTPTDGPGKHREHIFDFEDGMRLIISIDKGPEDELLHFSASMFKHIEGDTLKLAEQRFREMSGCDRPAYRHIVTPMGVPHWFISLW